MLIFIQRGTSVPFFLRFFRGFAPFRRFGHGERFPLRLRAGNGRQFGVAALVRRKAFTAGGFWLCPNDNGGGGDSCLRCRRKPYI